MFCFTVIRKNIIELLILEGPRFFSIVPLSGGALLIALKYSDEISLLWYASFDILSCDLIENSSCTPSPVSSKN